MILQYEDSNAGSEQAGAKRHWSQKSLTAYAMQAALQTARDLNARGRRELMTANNFDKVIVDAIKAAVKDSRKACGEAKTGHLLRVAVARDGYGPVVEEGLCQAFAEAVAEADPDRAAPSKKAGAARSEVEKAFHQAGAKDFHAKTECAELKAGVLRGVVAGNGWPLIEEVEAPPERLRGAKQALIFLTNLE